MSEGIQRRDFLKVLGVGSAGAAVSGCSTQSAEKLLPYVVPPEEITPGVATWYATVDGDSPYGYGLWARTREGRVVMLEGNPEHPINEGALTSQEHAALQHLYNPDRFTGPMQRVGGQLQPITWEEAEQLLATRMREAGSNVLFLHGHTGPSLSSLIGSVTQAVGGRSVGWEPIQDTPLEEAARIAFGAAGRPRYDIGSARFLLSFGSDFLLTCGPVLENTRGFMEMHHVDEHGTKGTFVYLGSRLNLSGQNADEWFPIAPGSEAVVALAMANVIARRGGDAGPYASLLGAYDPQSAAAASGLSAEAIEELATRFVEEGPGLALGPGLGGHHRGATAANLAVLVLNAVAGAVGRSLHFDGGAPLVSQAAMMEALRAAQGGVVLVRGVNPAYALPEGAGFAAAFGAAGFRVSFATAPDETSALCDLILPDAHFLESWGDSNPRPGLWAIQQPAMRPVPMFDSRATGDVLLGVLRQLGQDPGAADYRTFVQNRWSQLHATQGGGGDFQAAWREALRTGFVQWGGTADAAAPALQAANAALSFDAPQMDGDGLILTVHPSGRFGDGRYANSPWMLELPDPISKLMWQSWLEIHPATADELGVRDGDIVRVSSPHGELDVPVWLYPGIRRDTVALAAGMGHTDYGRWATNQGVNAMRLLGGETEVPSGATVLLSTRVQVTPTGDWKRPVTIAGSDSDHGRPIAPAVALAALGHAEEGEGGHGEGPIGELQLMGGFKPVETDGEPEDYPLPGLLYGNYADPENTPRWAMAIDLDKCTGCSACVTACQAENNIAYVGEDQAAMGRELHWMRIERYYAHVDAEHAGHVDVRRVPMLCQHCGNAPCEPVCPVFAAYHTPDGLNGQVYNRCVGTRYCANNCPYKVRVFNWYRYTQAMPEPLNWQFNPDVTVRDNGVMEKCTFCVQRIREVQNRARVENRALQDGEIVPACQHTCPADAIVFGNIRDPNSRVAQWTHNERTYRVLDELINTQPAVSYLKKVTHHEVAQAEH
ncbi:MAG: 4Fe-4S dicluster domain-containing protein [Gemmatimonadota bacterium]